MSTRELETSIREPAGSSGSSRSSSPLLYNGVSYEDIGANGSGLEMEEVFRLEKQLRVMEKAENAAVQKIRSLEVANVELAARVVTLEANSQKVEQEARAKVEAVQDQWTREKQALERELIQLKQLGNIEDIQVGFIGKRNLVQVTYRFVDLWD